MGADRTHQHGWSGCGIDTAGCLLQPPSAPPRPLPVGRPCSGWHKYNKSALIIGGSHRRSTRREHLRCCSGEAGPGVTHGTPQVATSTSTSVRYDTHGAPQVATIGRRIRRRFDLERPRDKQAEAAGNQAFDQELGGLAGEVATGARRRNVRRFEDGTRSAGRIGGRVSDATSATECGQQRRTSSIIESRGLERKWTALARGPVRGSWCAPRPVTWMPSMREHASRRRSEYFCTAL